MQNNRFIHLELSEYFNNNGFSYQGKFDEADFTGLGSSYPAEQLPATNEIVNVNNIPFLFPSKETSALNNIEFNNQKIVFDESYYCKIHILGAAENGSFREYSKLIGESGEKTVILGLTDWISESPQYNEKIAFRCKGIHTVKAGKLDTIKPTIWHQQIEVRDPLQFYTLQLTDNPGMHIFSITLEKDGVGNA